MQDAGQHGHHGGQLQSLPNSGDSSMDPASLFLVLQPTPVVVERHTVEWRGGLLPLVLPMAGLSAKQRAQLLLTNGSIDLDARVTAALDAGLTDEAWSLVIRTPGPINRSIGLQLVLAGWAAREQLRLGLPATPSAIQIFSPDGKGGEKIDATTVMSTTYDMLSALSWPRWAGPVVVVIGDLAAKDPIPGLPRLARPALPIIRLGEPTIGVTRNEQLGAELTRLTLELQSPPKNGWPAWLTVGLIEVAKAKIRGGIASPSPLKMHSIRQRAGTAGIATLLVAAKPDAELAGAVCAYLVHTRRRPLLGKLFDLIRGGAQSEGALRIVYEATPETLIEER